MTQGWEAGLGDLPTPPINGQVLSPLVTGSIDLRWDNPAILTENTQFDVVGVNIYRSDFSDRGPYRRLNVFPIGATFYRDHTDNTLISREIVDWSTAWLSKGDAPNNDTLWRFRTRCRPVVKNDPTQLINANAPTDVVVTIDGVRAAVGEVFGPTGEITLVTEPGWDDVTETVDRPTIPDENSEVLITYRTNINLIKTCLDRKLYYRITTVARDPSSASGLIETPLNFARPLMLQDVETLDWIWREAIRRNNWILEQCGERVKVFIRKQVGDRCFCGHDPRRKEFASQPSNRCLKCFGTGWIGGYDGPFDVIISPDDAERKIGQYNAGRKLEHMYEVWTGPYPLLTQRDFIVKQTNERYSIGPVRKPSVRGIATQQHFNIAYFEESDIRYKVPIPGVSEYTYPESRSIPPTLQGGAWPPGKTPPGPYPVGPYPVVPEITEKPNIPDEREIRRRTQTGENQTY